VCMCVCVGACTCVRVLKIMGAEVMKTFKVTFVEKWSPVFTSVCK